MHPPRDCGLRHVTVTKPSSLLPARLHPTHVLGFLALSMHPLSLGRVTGACAHAPSSFPPQPTRSIVMYVPLSLSTLSIVGRVCRSVRGWRAEVSGVAAIPSPSFALMLIVCSSVAICSLLSFLAHCPRLVLHVARLVRTRRKYDLAGGSPYLRLLVILVSTQDQRQA
jgi:hypothetical protein